MRVMATQFQRGRGDYDEVVFLLASREESGSPIDVYSAN
jgi:hypothetical protein